MVRSTRSSPGPAVVIMGRSYLGSLLIPLLLPAGLAATSLTGGLAPNGRAAALFEAQPVDASRFAVLARPVGLDGWTLLVLEQLRPSPLCWQNRPDGLVEASLTRFNFSGICARYLDSNGYSLRLADQEPAGGASGLRLRLEAVAGELQLQASSADQPGILVVGRAPLSRRQRDGFVPIRLDPGWELRRRSYGAQLLNHVYFSHPSEARQLLARAAASAATARPAPSGRGFPPLAPPPPPPPLLVEAEAPPRQPGRARRQPRRLQQARLQPAPMRAAPETDLAGQAGSAPAPQPGRVIALQVIPFQE